MKQAKSSVLICKNCKTEFVKLDSFLRMHPATKYCSRECMGESNKKQGTYSLINCVQCGKEFSKRTDHLLENNYCSRKCLGKSKKLKDAKWRNKEYIKNYMREYLDKNREKHNLRSRMWNVENREKKAISRMNRRSADKLGDFTSEQWAGMKKKYKYMCLCCGRKEPEVTLEADHIIAVANGGITTKDNIQPLCSSCNGSKGSNYIDYRKSYPHILFMEIAA